MHFKHNNINTIKNIFFWNKHREIKNKTIYILYVQVKGLEEFL